MQVLAVDVGVTHLTVARVGLGGAVLSRRDRTWSRGPGGRRHADGVVGRRPRGRAGCSPRSRPGRRSSASASPCPAWCGARTGWSSRPRTSAGATYRSGPQLADALGLPVSVGNDADLGMRAEHVRGAAAGRRRRRLPVRALRHRRRASSPAGVRSAAGPASPARSATPSCTPAAWPCHCGSHRLLGDRVRRGAPLRARRPAAGRRPRRACARSSPLPSDGDPAATAALQHVADLARPGHRQRRQHAQPRGRHPRRSARGGASSPPVTRCAPSSRPHRAAPRRCEQVRLVVPAPRLRLDPGRAPPSSPSSRSLSDPLQAIARRTAS